MANYLLLGAQWGDEGKGKLADLFAEKMDLVVRFQGGANAGHTVTVGKKKMVLHQLPSGILHKTTRNIVGNGCVLDLVSLNGEINGFKNLDVELTVSSQKLGENRKGLEGAKPPTTGDEPREFTSRSEGGRVPPFIEELPILLLTSLMPNAGNMFQNLLIKP